MIKFLSQLKRKYNIQLDDLWRGVLYLKKYGYLDDLEVDEKSSLFLSALDPNVGHALNTGVLLGSYGTVPEHKRGGILKGFKLE